MEFINVNDKLPKEEGHFRVKTDYDSEEDALYIPDRGFYNDDGKIKYVLSWTQLPEQPKEQVMNNHYLIKNIS